MTTLISKQRTSPSGKLVCESSGPLDAELVFVGESPAAEEMQATPPQPLIGRSGRLLSAACRSAGIDRTRCRIVNLIPVRAPGDKFARHDPRDVEWGAEEFKQEMKHLTGPKVVVALGAHPAETVLGKLPTASYGREPKDGFISEWRGSVVWLESIETVLERDRRRTALGMPKVVPEEYLRRLDEAPRFHSPKTWWPSHWRDDIALLATFHPAAVLRQYSWHPWFMQDVKRAAELLKGRPELPKRAWYFNSPDMLSELRGADVLSFDTEQDPDWIIGIAAEDQVHVFKWEESARAELTALLTARNVVKVAHNWNHDYTFFRKYLGITPTYRLFDTMGAAHTLNTALQKELSPHIASRFTHWPYHKWLRDVDVMLYNGMDAVTCWDAYWPQIGELCKRGLKNVAEHDHRLLIPLLQMQAFGFRIDEAERMRVEEELQLQLNAAKGELQNAVAPIVAARISSFEKPHLFRKQRRCTCCGGGSTQRHKCRTCAGFSKRSRPSKSDASARGFKTIKAMDASFGDCRQCGGSGVTVVDLPFNVDSSDQLADVLYRGLRIKPRRYKGRETVKAAQLDGLRDRSPLIGQLIDVSKMTADLDTVKRLTAGMDGRLHCVFDPWGTQSGRVAGKSGLLEAGTNPMNLPLLGRRFVLPDDGHFLLYPDMEQVEARAIAAYSKDGNLIHALNDPVTEDGRADYHLWIVARMAERGINISRPQSKRVSYAGFYGVRAIQLAKELTAEAFRKGDGIKVTEQQATIILDTLWKILPGVRAWQQQLVTEVEQTRRLRCPLTGRERTWTDYILDRKTKGLRYEIAKQVWSYLPQHLAAWVLALGLNDLYYSSGEWGKLLQPLIHVHDALLMQAPIGRRAEAIALAERTLTRDVFGTHFACSMKTGTNWYECSV